jgi:hypothetical protein
MNLRLPAVFIFLDELSGAQTTDFARAVESLGYSALWITEVFARVGRPARFWEVCPRGRGNARSISSPRSPSGRSPKVDRQSNIDS